MSKYISPRQGIINRLNVMHMEQQSLRTGLGRRINSNSLKDLAGLLLTSSVLRCKSAMVFVQPIPLPLTCVPDGVPKLGSWGAIGLPSTPNKCLAAIIAEWRIPQFP